jgi:hypothetical protein
MVSSIPNASLGLPNVSLGLPNVSLGLPNVLCIFHTSVDLVCPSFLTCEILTSKALIA